MEIYQWLFRKNSFKVSSTGYFVYCNGLANKNKFDARLDFDIKIIPYDGNDSWIEDKIIEIHRCLMSSEIPNRSAECDFCIYNKALEEVGEKKH